MNTKITSSLRPYQIFFAVLGAVCVAAIATNLVVRRVPVHDATAANDLVSISNAIDQYASTQSRLPASLSDVSGLASATQKRLGSYEYTPLTASTYQLCATFLGTGSSTANSYPVPSGAPDPSRHGAGRACFHYNALTYTGGPLGRPVPPAQ